VDQPHRTHYDTRLDALDTRLDNANTQLTEINAAIRQCHTQIGELLHGNGRQGLHAICDDLYGPRHRERPGLFARVVLLEKNVQTLTDARKETRWLQRGIAIGVTLVLIDTVLDLELARLIGGIFGAS
jgi:hypothetical protein